MYLGKVYYLFFLSCPVVLCFFLFSAGVHFFLWRRKIPREDLQYSYKSVFQKGEYYRIYSSLFCHSDVSHFFVNILSLIGLSVLEEKIGSWTLFIQFLAAPIVIKLVLSGIYSFVYSKYPRESILEIPVLGLSSFILAFVTTQALTYSKEYYIYSIDNGIAETNNALESQAFTNETFSNFTASNSSILLNHENSSYSSLVPNVDFGLTEEIRNSSDSSNNNSTSENFDPINDPPFKYQKGGIIFDDDSTYQYNHYDNTIVLFGFMEIPAFVAPVFFLLSSHLIIWKSNLIDNFSGMFVGILIAGGSFNFLQNLYWFGCFLFWVISISLYSMKPSLIFSMLPLRFRRFGNQYIQIARQDSDSGESDEENQLHLSDMNSSNDANNRTDNINGVELTSFNNRAVI